MALLVPAWGLLLLGGCGTDHRQHHLRPYAHVHPAAEPSGNPWLIFQTPPARASGIIPENIGRYPWPLAQVPGGYISGPEIISYREYYYSNAHQSGDGRAREYLNRRVYGTRAVEQIR